MHTATSGSYSAAMEGCRVVRFEQCVAWAFACKMRQVEKSSRFKYGEYGGKSVRNQNSANSRWVVFAV